MKNRIFATAVAVCLLAGVLAAAAQRPATIPQPAQPPNTDSTADSYFNYMMGHLYEGNFRSSSQKADADRAVEFYKKAYAQNPANTVIGAQLAEMYFVAQQIGDAIVEAQAVLKRDPQNLAARRLLSRIYIRSLSDQQNAIKADESARANLAIEQLREIVRMDSTDSESALWLARLYRLTGQDDAAEKTLRSLLARDADEANAIEQLGQLLVDQGKAGDAVPLLEHYLDESPNPDLYDLLGDAYTRLNNLSGAEKSYRQSVQMEPDRARHVRGLAQALFNEDRFNDALTQYQRLLELRPDDAESHLRMSTIYRRLQRLDDAEREILLARKNAPNNLEVIYNQATLNEEQGRYVDAVRVATEAINMVKAQDITPGRRRNLAILYQLQGRLNRTAGNYPAAVSSFQELQKLGPEEDQRARLLIVESYQEARDLPSAFGELRQALTAYPKDRTLLTTQALLQAENGEPDVAAKSFRALLMKSPADREIYVNMAHAYLQNRRFPEAEEAIRSAEALATDADDKEGTEMLRAALYEHQQKYDLAEQSFKSVIASNPRHSGALNYYGYMLAERGTRLDEAIDLINRALAEEPGNPSFLDSMGWVRFKQDRLPEAEEILRKAVARNSHNPEILAHLGDVLAKSGQDDLAAAQWEKALGEWKSSLPAEQEPAKIAELEQKLTRLKNRIAQRPATAPQSR
jgi:tetratricopeptide (TPR) repeat protein